MSHPSARHVIVAGVALGCALAGLGWFDYRAVTGELNAALAAQAEAVHATVAAAARAQHAAAAQAEEALAASLLESARLLRELDRVDGLTGRVVEEFGSRNASQRIAVFSADGVREFASGEGGRGWGEGRGWGDHRGAGRGPWGGPPAGAARVLQRLLDREAEEIVTPPHAARDGHHRVAAGIRRARGGAIVLNASSEAARRLDDVFSLSALLSEIASSTPSLAYIVIDADGRRVSGGPLAEEAGDEAPGEGTGYRRLAGGPVLEYRRSVALDESSAASLRVGMSLDDVSRGERRTLIRTVTGMSAAFALALVALAFVTLRRQFGALSEEHARAQDALRRRDRLAAMGELASTVAHEIRNPLNAIAMSAQRLAREYPAPRDAADHEELDDLLGVIQRESTRINRTIEEFLEYARPRPVVPEAADLRRLLDNAAASAGPVAAVRGVAIAVRCDPGLQASLDVGQMTQVIDNLLRNAAEATAPGGTVWLEARRDGRDIEIEVRDRGRGIAAADLPRIFDLYFTTRPEGTGVGLAVAQQIVAAHGGTIDVESAEGSGTTVRVRLPQGEVEVG